MKRICIAGALLLCLFMTAQAFSQTNASVSGTVSDPMGAIIPGGSVTATNDDTGVVSTAVTNAAGVYNFASLLPGVYTITATQPGFHARTFTRVQLGSGAQLRLNFQLELAGVATQIEVSSSAEELLLEASSSVGDVLISDLLVELPLVKRDALELVRVMSGVVMTDNTIFNANESSFAGVGANAVNIQRDGVQVNDVRWPTGVNAATRVNPDMVGEFKMILAPVDAEMGRGNAQVQVITRSGTNEYRGSMVWNAQNTALDPNTWENNRRNVAPPWRNLHGYSASFSGPIVRNKTFFFVLFDGQLNKIRTPYNVRSLTACAQRGIFRYYDNWNNGNSLQLLDRGTEPRIAVVNAAGVPTPPVGLTRTDVNPDGTLAPGGAAHNGILRYASVFGPILNTGPLAPDCSDVRIGTTPWDPLRTGFDPTGFVQDFLQMMPVANNYDIGDGLNTAGHRWSRTLNGADNLFGVGEDTYRRQLNVRVDHNISDVHRVSGSWSWEKSWADDNFKTWPNGFGGKSERRPQVLTLNFVSSLRPTLLNEFRFGRSRTGANVTSAYTNPDTGSALRELLPKMANGVPVVAGLGMGAFGFGPTSSDGFSNFYGGRGILSYSGKDSSPRYSFSNTMTWALGTHSLRFGGEFRRASSEARNQWTGPFFAGFNSYPYIEGGESGAPTTGIDATNMPGLAGTPGSGNIRAMKDMLVLLSGSMAQIRQWRYINRQNDTSWNDPIADPAIVRDVVQKEFSLFFKDDWKATADLT
ncbi:MAG TPA: carboxypeptidase regulatory-like domain-containing protein, partial [Acidobacteriota bacterium]|nr:carboxypeptidase regulatory-like domain-containing protein [Acidobacteriota bacterium]